MLKVAMRELKIMLTMYKSRLIIFIVFPILYTFINDKSDFFSFYALMGGIMMLAGPEMENRDKVYISVLSAPCKRSEYVIGKFLAAIIWMIIIVISGVLINYGLCALIPQEVSAIDALSIKLIPMYMCLFISIYYMVIFVFGQKIAKAWYLITFFLVMIGVMGASELIAGTQFQGTLGAIINFIGSTSMVNTMMLIILELAIIGILGTVSVTVYEKRDL